MKKKCASYQNVMKEKGNIEEVPAAILGKITNPGGWNRSEVLGFLNEVRQKAEERRVGGTIVRQMSQVQVSRLLRETTLSPRSGPMSR